jgi:hypothetical protein
MLRKSGLRDENQGKAQQKDIADSRPTRKIISSDWIYWPDSRSSQ